MAGTEEDQGGESTTLENTPTWALGVVCFTLIAVSVLIEHALHLLAKYLQGKKRKALLHALNKIKSDLMLLGFISLMLTVVQKPIAKICIPRSVGETFLPCQSLGNGEGEESKCENQGKMSLMSTEGTQQLQMLIFVLAFFHVFSSLLTFSLGMAKMKRWESWEAETRTIEYQFSNDPRRFQFIHHTSFGKRHLRYWSEQRILRLPVVFFRQFFESVSRIDYLTLRHGFIMARGEQETDFDFQKYLKRNLEKDFGVVIGMSLWIWIFSVLFILFNAYVFHNYMWLPFIPLVMLLVVGTKLQSIITNMCLDTNDKSYVVRGSLLVKPSDHFFWFSRPKLLLHLMHFILFQNSFQLAFFSWTWYKFGLRSCFHRQTEDIVIKLTMGFLVQVLCGYVTLPLYALVTQMGTSDLTNVFPEEVVKGLRRWRRKAKKNIAGKNNYRTPPSVDASLDYSLTSLSFSTLDASLSAELGITADDELHTSVEIADEGSGGATKQMEMEKLGSFEGFDHSEMINPDDMSKGD